MSLTGLVHWGVQDTVKYGTHVSYSEGSFVGYDIFGKSSLLDDSFLWHEFNDWFLLQVSATPNKKVTIPEKKATSTSNKEYTLPSLWGLYGDIPLVFSKCTGIHVHSHL